MSRSIEWRRDERRIVLPVLILPPTPSTDLTWVSGRALLDTGATTSGITPTIARRLGLAPRGKRPMGFAKGEGQVERYLFRVALMPDADPDQLPQFPFVFEDVVGFELTETFLLDALIGMDVLSQCDFRMERNGLCRLDF